MDWGFAGDSVGNGAISLYFNFAGTIVALPEPTDIGAIRPKGYLKTSSCFIRPYSQRELELPRAASPFILTLLSA